MDPNRLEFAVKQHENTLYRAALAILDRRPRGGGRGAGRLHRLPGEGPGLRRPGAREGLAHPGDGKRLQEPPSGPLAAEDRAPAGDLPSRHTRGGETLEAVLALPPRERAAVHLFYYEGYRTAEIAAMTGEAEGTVRARLSRARKKLKHLLEDETP